MLRKIENTPWAAVVWTKKVRGEWADWLEMIERTVTQITTRYNQGMQNTISERTTRRTLKQKTKLGASDGYFQQDNAPCHTAQIISDWFLEHGNEFTLLKWLPVTRSQSNRAPLGCGGTGDSHHGCAAEKSAETAWCYHVNMDQNLWGMFPTPCWIYATKKAKWGPTWY